MTETGELFTHISPKESTSVSYNSVHLILARINSFAATVTLRGLLPVSLLDSIFDFGAIYIVCLFISYASPLILFSLFSYLSLPLLIFSFENIPAPLRIDARWV